MRLGYVSENQSFCLWVVNHNGVVMASEGEVSSSLMHRTIQSLLELTRQLPYSWAADME